MDVIKLARYLRRLLLVFVSHSLKAPLRARSAVAVPVFALTLVSGFAVTGAQATTPTVGTIPVSAGVSATGAATYSIPITIPPGTKGMQPSLALIYSSQSSDGWAGYGWTLSGFSAITRCAKNPEDDNLTYNVPVQYSTNISNIDDLCLDGQRLRLISGTYGADGATYGTEIEGFSLITSHGTGTGGPVYFTAQTKDGRTYEYGNTTDSSIVASGTSVVRTWALDKVVDGNGNYMTYQYGGSSIEYWPTYINYTGNGSTTPDHQIQFDFQTKNAMVRGQYTAGSFSQTSKMLQDIKVNYGGAATLTYKLSYNLDGGGGRDLLSSVQECGNDGSCLPSTTIAWNPSAAGWGSQHNTGISVTNLGRAQAAKLMDVDGDGIDDLVYPGNDWMVAFGQPGGGFGPPVDTGIAVPAPYTYFANALAMDYNGDGCMDLVTPTSSGTWQVMISNCTQGPGAIFSTHPDNNDIVPFTQNNTQSGKPIFEGNLWVGSGNGDGITDIFDNAGNYIQLRKNYAPPNDGAFNGWTNLIPIGSGQKMIAQGSVDVGLDFDGSGRAGALAYLGSSGPWVAYVPVGPLGPDSYQQLATQSGNSNPAVPFDLNGDGLTDLLTNSTSNQWQITLSTGKGFNNLLYNLYNDVAGADPIVADYYGNGTQVAIVDSNSGWYILDPTPDGSGGYNRNSVSLSSGIYPYNSNYGTGTLRVGSITSYGLSDLVYAINNGDGTYNFYYKLHNFTSGSYPDVVSSVEDGYGNSYVFHYETLSDGGSIYSKSGSPSYPIKMTQSPMPVVSSEIVNIIGNHGGGYNFTYTYANAELDSDGHGFLGFGKRTITDSRSGNTETITYDQAFPWTGMITQDVLKESAGTEITETDNSGADQLSLPVGPDGSQRHFPFFDSSIRHDYDTVSGTVAEVRKTTSTQSQSSFDSYGDLLSSSTVVMDETQAGDPTYTTQATTTYAPPSSNYCVSLPQTVVVTRTVPAGSLGVSFPNPGDKAVSDNEDTGHCRLNSETVAAALSGSGSTPSLTSTYTYDGFGNATEVDVTGVNADGTNLPTHTTTYSYSIPGNSGTYNEELPVSSTNVVSGSVSLTNQATWNYALGTQISTTDPNGHQTSYSYDAYGRLQQITRPDGSSTQIALAPCAFIYNTYPCSIVSDVYQVVTTQLGNDGSSFVSGYENYDGLGRVTDQAIALLGGAMSVVSSSYDAFSNPLTVSRPYTGATASFYSRYTYDPLMDRLLSISTPQDENDSCGGGGSTPCQNNSVYTYSGFSTTVAHTVGDSASSSSTQTTVQTRDALGRTLTVVDSNGGTTSYNYDAFSDLVATKDADGNITAIGYDGLGHKTSMADPNLGNWTYAVDALGEVKCQTDAKNQSIIMGYDAIGRVTSKLETAAGAGCGATTGTSSSWTYDTEPMGLGMPTSVSDSNGFGRAYDYDSLSRPMDVTTTIAGTPYTITTGYDAYSRVNTVTYPASVSPATSGTTPTAVAAATPSSGTLGASVTLNGSSSTDPNGLPLQYQWKQTAGPSLGLGAIDTASVTTTFTPSVAGVYTFQLQVIDSSSNLSAPVSVSVTIAPAVPGAPSPSANPSTGLFFNLTWTQVTGAASYAVYKSTDNITFTQIGTVSSASYPVYGLANGTYYFAIASAANGATSARGPSSVGVVVSGESGSLVEPQDTYEGLALRRTEGGTVLAKMVDERNAVIEPQPMQPAESVLQSRADRFVTAKLPSIEPAVSAAELSKQQQRLLADSADGRPLYALPVYAAYAGAKLQPATGSAYRFEVQYSYDPSSGALQAASDANTQFIYWRAATSSGVAPVDPFGHLLAYTDGNNVSTVSVFDQATGAVDGISTGVGASTAVQQLVYSWDGFGNLKQRCDANRGLTESFTYDGINRLSTSTVNTGASSCAGGTAGAAMSLTYDMVGNIQARSNTGLGINDTYTYDSSHPYAVSTVTSIPGTYTYDAGGNMTSGNGRSITWNDANLPVSITSSATVNGNNTVTGTSTFSYSPDKHRYLQTAFDNSTGVTTTTTYIGNLFQVLSTASSTQFQHSIMANGAVVAVHTLDQAGNASTAYIHEDHLGSSDTETNNQGTVALQMSFDAFGLHRDPSNWSYDLTTTQIATQQDPTHRGYTYQEQLDNVGLVHMNGRVYDPSIGRMISADPTIPQPLNSQAYNRYAYVYNNPLRFIDPTGYCGDGLFEILCRVTSAASNALSDAASDAASAASALASASQSFAEDNLKFAQAGLNLQRVIASDYTHDVREFTDANFGLAVAGFDLQIDIARDYTHGVRQFASANTAFAKHWTHESITFAANPVMNIEYSAPFIGNWFNVRMAHSQHLQWLGQKVADDLSGDYGYEIDGGYAAYLAALHGDNNDWSLLRIGGRTTVDDWFKDEKSEAEDWVKQQGESELESELVDYGIDW